MTTPPAIKGPVGLIGLGLVGRALAARLHAHGIATLGHDRDPHAMQAYAATGGEPIESLPHMARRAAIVLLAVFDTQGVLQVVEGPAGLLEASGEGEGGPRLRHLIDCSTGEPQALQALAARLQTRGIHFTEAPLSGSSEQIAAGEATALVGAEAAAWQAAQPLLALLAACAIHIGPPGMGARAKLATNLVLGLNRAVFAEGLVFAERLGIAPATFLQLVLATPARSDAAAVKGPQMVSGDYQPRSRIRQHLKDLRLMLAAAQAQGTELPFTAVHAAVLQQAVEDGLGDLDNAAVVEALRRRRGASESVEGP